MKRKHSAMALERNVSRLFYYGDKSMEFKEFSKIARWSRNITITEKIDGTNASILIGENGEFLTMTKTGSVLASSTPRNGMW